MKNIQPKNHRLVLVVAIILAISVLLCGCNKATDKERFERKRGTIVNIADYQVHTALKEFCLKALEEKGINVEDMFLRASYVDEDYLLELHTLTENEKYVRYKIVPQENIIELGFFIYSGKPSDPIYSSAYKEVCAYLENDAEASIDTENQIITIS